MTRAGITEAKSLAKRFVSAAEACLAELDADNKSDGYIVGTRRSGHLRRFSMEMTRALAAMRRP